MIYNPNKNMDHIFREYTEAALAYYGGNKALTAKRLGITTKCLYNWLHKWGLFEKYKGRMGPIPKAELEKKFLPTGA